MRVLPETDIAIIGGGPAGAAAGALAARAGLRTVLFEKEKFPRFCIGESLLPKGNSVLRELGVLDKVDQAGFLRKYGAEFVTGDTTRRQRFWFRNQFDADRDYTYQVERSVFDKLLLDHAREQGCAVYEQTRVRTLDTTDPEAMTLTYDGPEGSGSLRARWVIDASGRNAFAGGRLGMRRNATQRERRIAIYGHFEGVFRNAGKAEGHVTIVRSADRWFWLIPLAGGRTSVGLVLPSERAGPNADLDALFADSVRETPEMTERMARATALTPLRATGDYSWKFSSFATGRVVLTGDAAGFVDPVFSSGVLLALRSGMQAVRMIRKADAAGRGLTSRECTAYTRTITRWMHQYIRVIDMFYDRAGFEVFMNPAAFFAIPTGIGRLVGGDTDLGFLNRLRITLFRILCRFQRVAPIAPAIPSLR